jgi:hypothetical protein
MIDSTVFENHVKVAAKESKKGLKDLREYRNARVTRCAFPRCRATDNGTGIVYLGRWLCENHWRIFAEDERG